MKRKALHQILVEFLNDNVEGEEPIIADKDSDFAHALTAMWAEKKLEHDKYKEHFSKLDEAYKTRIIDLKTKHDVFDDEKVTSLMKAALDDIQESAPDQLFGGNTNIIPDDIIRAFLSDSDD